MYDTAQQTQAIIEEIEELKKASATPTIPEKLKDRISRMIERLERMARFGSYSAEFEVVSKYIEQINSIPWTIFTKDTIDLTAAKQLMDKNHHGMEGVKQMILDYLAVMKLKESYQSPQQTNTPVTDTQVLTQAQVSQETPPSLQQSDPWSAAQPIQQEVAWRKTQLTIPAQQSFDSVNNEMPSSQTSSRIDESKLKGASGNAPILCFVGLQGVGKTTMAKSIAQALGRKFTRIPMGALGSVSELRGIPRSKLDADPGFIIKALQRTGSMNPVILLDEIDKTSGHEGLRSDMMAVLLEILDPQQNSHFVDYYIDHPIDLSQVFFITTANTTGTISTALLDRLETIRFTSYSDEEKIVIGKNYLLPRVLESLGLNTQQVVFTEDVWPQIVRPIGFDAGIRQLERNVTKICRHAARQIVESGVAQVTISPQNVREYLPVDVAVLN
ncbi:AAA family ATPase [Candidatus Dojkabacteria bacterium]|nr:AAA family ATPase [Candidatus Dojkabacteria bacterium]